MHLIWKKIVLTLVQRPLTIITIYYQGLRNYLRLKKKKKKEGRVDGETGLRGRGTQMPGKKLKLPLQINK